MDSDRAPANLGQVVLGARAITPGLSPRRVRHLVLLLATSVGLLMTGYGITLPVFARRFGELGAGVEALSLTAMAFALAQFAAAPFMGALADRWGRRPLVLLALAAFALANLAYLAARSPAAFVLVSGANGGLTAGLFPATLGLIADVVPEGQRGRWIGLVMGGYGAGLVLGPVVGGLLYDGWGFAAPFVASGAVAGLALVAAAVSVPETRTDRVRWRQALAQRRAADALGRSASVWDSLPRPVYVLGLLLAVEFSGAFAIAFVEPQMVFYFYDDLGWSSTRFGLAVGSFGLAQVLGQTTLGHLSDRWGRKPAIALGLALNATLYLSLATLRSFPLMLLSALVAGLGAALVLPAVSAFVLDITSERHRARLVGIKESAWALGEALGPLTLIILTPLTTPRAVFALAGGLLLAVALLVALLLRQPRPAIAGERGGQPLVRALRAQTALQGLAVRAKRLRAGSRETFTPLAGCHLEGRK